MLSFVEVDKVMNDFSDLTGFEWSRAREM